MAAGRPPFLTARKVRILDVTVVVWVVVWVLLGVLIGRAIWDVGRIADPVIRNANGLSDTARGFERLGSLPLVGGALGDLVGGVTGAADTTRAEAQAVKDRIEAVGLAAGLLIALTPVLVALVFYVPVRLPWRRGRPGDPRRPCPRSRRPSSAAVPRRAGSGEPALRPPARAERRALARHRERSGRAPGRRRARAPRPRAASLTVTPRRASAWCRRTRPRAAATIRDHTVTRGGSGWRRRAGRPRRGRRRAG